MKEKKLPPLEIWDDAEAYVLALVDVVRLEDGMTSFDCRSCGHSALSDGEAIRHFMKEHYDADEIVDESIQPYNNKGGR